MDFLSNLQTFVAIADNRSISKAARLIRLSVPMASRRLRSLEAEIGVELFRRSTRHLLLTEAGGLFLEHARRILEEVQDAKETVRPGQGVTGTLVVSVPVWMGLTQIAPLVPGFLAKHPRLKLDMRFEDRAVDMVAENIDIAVRAGIKPPDSRVLIARALMSFERELCASPHFLARYKGLKDVRALENIPCLVESMGPARWHLKTPTGAVDVEVDGPLRASNIQLRRDCTVAGIGAAILPTAMIGDDLKAKRLVPAFKNVKPVAGTVYGLYHRSGRSSVAVRAFFDYVIESMVAAKSRTKS